MPYYKINTAAALAAWDNEWRLRDELVDRKPGALNADSLTKAFVKALKATDLVYKISPPSFHEIRSLASRLYEAEYGKEFAQKLLGHKSMKMTNVYLDSRKNEWVEI